MEFRMVTLRQLGGNVASRGHYSMSFQRRIVVDLHVGMCTLHRDVIEIESPWSEQPRMCVRRALPFEDVRLLMRFWEKVRGWAAGKLSESQVTRERMVQIVNAPGDYDGEASKP